MLLMLLLITYTVATTNCVGCFNPVQGICLLNPNNTCALFTKSQCVAKGIPWQWSNTSLNTWPSGCLSIIEAQGFACGGLLPMCPEVNHYLPHANSAKLCGKSAGGVQIIGFDDMGVINPEAYNCFAIKEFGGGCVWEGWEYYSFKKDWQKKDICSKV